MYKQKKIQIHSDSSENVAYNYEDFPLYIRTGYLHKYHYHISPHWHPDIEFVHVLTNNMTCFVNGRDISLHSGEGVIINSRRLHYFYSAEEKDCSFQVISIHPSLLYQQSDLVKNYLEEFLAFDKPDYLTLSPDTPWQSDVLVRIQTLSAEAAAEKNNFLSFLAQAAWLSQSFCKHLRQQENKMTPPDISQINILPMLNYIHENYANKISVDEIASAGNMCRSKCYRQFQKFMGKTPNDYLTKYRIDKSCQQLLETDLPIIEIALNCGFQNASYFSRVFQKETGSTPKTYRTIMKQE